MDNKKFEKEHKLTSEGYYSSDINTQDYNASLAKSDEEELTDKDIISLSTADGFPMTDYQSQHFVIGDAITDYRKRRQALLEIEVRRQSLHAIIKDKKYANAKLAVLERDIAMSSDELHAAVLDCEADDLRYDLSVWETKEPQARRELASFISMFRKLLPDDPTIGDVKQVAVEDPKLEREYWITRMAKQCSMDMITHGRIGTGNLGSIMQMEVVDQKDIMNSAIEYTLRFDQTVHALGDGVKEKLLGLTQEEITTPSLIQDLSTENILNNAHLQLSTKSKTKSEAV